MISALHIIGVGREVLSAAKDGTVRLWNVGEAKEVRKWTSPHPIEGMVVISDQDLAIDADVIVVASADGTITGFSLSESASSEPLFTLPPALPAKLLSIAYSPTLGLVATGHANGVIALRTVSSLRDGAPPTLIRRNEGTVLSLAFDSTSLLVGTGSGLPARLSVGITDGKITAQTAEEYAGWEPIAVEAWAVGSSDVFCAGTEGGIRRYKASS